MNVCVKFDTDKIKNDIYNLVKLNQVIKGCIMCENDFSNGILFVAEVLLWNVSMAGFGRIKKLSLSFTTEVTSMLTYMHTKKK